MARASVTSVRWDTLSPPHNPALVLSSLVTYTFLVETIHCNTTAVRQVKLLVYVCVQRVLPSVVYAIALGLVNVTLPVSRVTVQIKQLGPALVSGHYVIYRCLNEVLIVLLQCALSHFLKLLMI